MKMAGQKIVSISTLNTMYANNQLKVIDDEGNEYRLPVSTIMQMIDGFEFTIEKKRIYNHLVEATELEEEL